jgi:hypothetical protein
MKTKNTLFFLTLITYTYLFYEQKAGVNFLIFNLFLIGLSAYLFPKLLKQQNWIIAGIGASVSATMIVIFHSNLAILSNVISIIIMVGLMYNVSSSIYISIFHGFLSMFVPFFQSINKFLNSFSNVPNEKVKSNYSLKKYTIYIVPMLVTICFYLLYSFANPVFANLISFPKIKISLSLVTFLFTGWVGASGFFNPFGDEKLWLGIIQTKIAFQE